MQLYRSTEISEEGTRKGNGRPDAENKHRIDNPDRTFASYAEELQQTDYLIEDVIGSITSGIKFARTGRSCS